MTVVEMLGEVLVEMPWVVGVPLGSAAVPLI